MKQHLEKILFSILVLSLVLTLVLGFCYIGIRPPVIPGAQPEHDLLLPFLLQEHQENRLLNSGLGNVAARYAYGYLKAVSEGKTWVDKKKSDYLLQFFPSLQTNYIGGEKKNFPEMSTKILTQYPLMINYPHDIKFFQNHEKELQDLFGTSNITCSEEFDVVIHIRLDDIETAPDFYSFLPASFYRNALNSIEKKDKILIVSKNPSGSLQIAARKVVEMECKKNKNVQQVITRSRMQKDDFWDLMTAKILILSASTFSFWAAFLSPCIKEVHIPNFGVLSDLDKAAPIHAKQWHPPNKKVVVHDLKPGFRKIRGEKDLND